MTGQKAPKGDGSHGPRLCARPCQPWVRVRASIAAMIVLPSLGRVALSGRYASDGR
jgi:hypothetical protein